MSRISGVFLKGLITLFPILLTVYLLAWITSHVDAIFSEPLRSLLPTAAYFPGIGVVLVIALIFIVGLLVNSYLTRPFVSWLEAQIQRLPVIKSIYSPIKDMTTLFANSRSHEHAHANRAVMIQLPGLGGIEAVGLITRDHFEDLPPGAVATGSVAVFIPFSYGVGGFTLLVPRSQVREMGISSEKALQLAITGWIKS